LFQIKICGITRVEDAVAAAGYGADAIGLNFYEKSSRYVKPDQAALISDALPAGVCRVGVFVNSPVEDVARIAETAQLDVIQLHGDEPAGMLGELKQWPVIRAFRCRDAGLGLVTDFIDQCNILGAAPAAVLLDAYAEGVYGGTGHRLDWNALSAQSDDLGQPPFILAGGLTPTNVGRAIDTVCPLAVDTASGVESAPGIKDPIMMRDFIAQAVAAFGRRGK